jgi:hypothetical protein
LGDRGTVEVLLLNCGNAEGLSGLVGAGGWVGWEVMAVPVLLSVAVLADESEFVAGGQFLNIFLVNIELTIVHKFSEKT